MSLAKLKKPICLLLFFLCVWEGGGGGGRVGWEIL